MFTSVALDAQIYLIPLRRKGPDLFLCARGNMIRDAFCAGPSRSDTHSLSLVNDAVIHSTILFYIYIYIISFIHYGSPFLPQKYKLTRQPEAKLI